MDLKNLRRERRRRGAGPLLGALALAALLLAPPPPPARAQSLENERRRGLDILETVRKEVEKSYYDPAFGGRDLDAHFAAAAEKIKQASSIGQVLGVVAQTLMQFDDSHTYFVPPPPADHVEHGWLLQMVGDRCYVTAVRKGSDAEAKGLRPGDEVLSVGGHTPTRRNLWKLLYFLRSAYAMSVTVRGADGQPRQREVLAKVRKGKPVLDLRRLNSGSDVAAIIRESENNALLLRHRYAESDEGLFVWKMPLFGSEQTIDEMMRKAAKSRALVLDLRGNVGGYEASLLRLVGHFFDRDVKVGDLKGRRESRPLVARSRGASAYGGRLVVLVDSESASSAELFARLVQLEKRGAVVGDRTAGSVMQGTFTSHKSGLDLVFYYGVSVTSADLVMTDGRSLERAGVTPDELVLPSAEDLAAGRDPALARAAALAGFKLDPDKAGQLFPAEWRP